jgi:hypothetical protein
MYDRSCKDIAKSSRRAAAWCVELGAAKSLQAAPEESRLRIFSCRMLSQLAMLHDNLRLSETARSRSFQEISGDEVADLDQRLRWLVDHRPLVWMFLWWLSIRFVCLPRSHLNRQSRRGRKNRILSIPLQ